MSANESLVREVERRVNELLLVNCATGVSACDIVAVVKPFLGATWFPIETAPKDGTKITLWSHNARAVMPYCAWRRAWWYEYDLGGWSRLEPHETPTHWMPIPGDGP